MHFVSGKISDLNITPVKKNASKPASVRRPQTVNFFPHFLLQPNFTVSSPLGSECSSLMHKNVMPGSCRLRCELWAENCRHYGCVHQDEQHKTSGRNHCQSATTVKPQCNAYTSKCRLAVDESTSVGFFHSTSFLLLHLHDRTQPICYVKEAECHAVPSHLPSGMIIKTRVIASLWQGSNFITAEGKLEAIEISRQVMRQSMHPHHTQSATLQSAAEEQDISNHQYKMR